MRAGVAMKAIGVITSATAVARVIRTEVPFGDRDATRATEVQNEGR